MYIIDNIFGVRRKSSTGGKAREYRHFFMLISKMLKMTDRTCEIQVPTVKSG